jgi:mitogen-activated protein kinase kinase kinase 1
MGPPRPAQDPASSPSGSGSGSSRRRFRWLDRRNASKNIGYDAANFCSYPPSPTPASAPGSGPASLACSLDLVNSFRIGGSGDGGGDVRLLCHSLGLSGPDDFAIPLADWEAHKAVRLSSASSSPSSARANPDAPTRDSPLRREGPAHSVDPELPAKEPAARDAPIGARERLPQLDVLQSIRLDLKKVAGEGGIKGVRRPPSVAIPSVCRTGSTWDILASFAPDEQEHAPASKSGGAALKRQEEDEDEEAAVVLTLEELRLGEMSDDFTGTSSLSTVNDDETSSTTTESMFYISPNGRFRRKIRSWNRGMILGSGSFGTVYEGISEYVPYKLDQFLICRFIISRFNLGSHYLTQFA